MDNNSLECPNCEEPLKLEEKRVYTVKSEIQKYTLEKIKCSRCGAQTITSDKKEVTPGLNPASRESAPKPEEKRERDWTIECQCPKCGKNSVLTVVSEDNKWYQTGLDLISRCFPYRNIPGYEIINTGLCYDCQQKVYSTMNYDQYTLEELKKLTNEYIITHRDNGGSSEFDKSINNISRALIRKFHETNGSCFLGKIHQRKKLTEGEKAKLIPYSGQLVYNFEYDFTLSQEDECLIDLLTICNNNISNETINSIFDRIKELGGMHLFWV